MPKFLIEWGYEGGPRLQDVIERDTLEEAIREADAQAEDLWESNKPTRIATAKPFRDKHEQLSGDIVSGNRGVRDVDPVGRPAGSPGTVIP